MCKNKPRQTISSLCWTRTEGMMLWQQARDERPLCLLLHNKRGSLIWLGKHYFPLCHFWVLFYLTRWFVEIHQLACWETNIFNLQSSARRKTKAENSSRLSAEQECWWNSRNETNKSSEGAWPIKGFKTLLRTFSCMNSTHVLLIKSVLFIQSITSLHKMKKRVY